MTKTQIGYRSGKNEHDARSFLYIPYNATRESVAQRIIDDIGGRYSRPVREKNTTFAVRFDAIVARLSLLQKVCADNGLERPQFSSIAYLKNGGVLPYPAMIRSEYPNASGQARRILFSLASASEVKKHFETKRHLTVPTPLLLGDEAIQLFQELQNKK